MRQVIRRCAGQPRARQVDARYSNLKKGDRAVPVCAPSGGGGEGDVGLSLGSFFADRESPQIELVMPSVKLSFPKRNETHGLTPRPFQSSPPPAYKTHG